MTSGPSACHAIIITADGRTFTMGRRVSPPPCPPRPVPCLSPPRRRAAYTPIDPAIEQLAAVCCGSRSGGSNHKGQLGHGDGGNPVQMRLPKELLSPIRIIGAR